MSLVFVDVEASGKEGGGGISPYSGVMTEFGAVDWLTGKTFYGQLWNARPRKDNPALSLPLEHYGRDDQIMQEFATWLKVTSEGMPVFISDNNGYDYQWINYYFDKAGIDNPFGHSSRRIGDFYTGLCEDWRAGSKWKKFRKTKHDHHPVHDAQGNVEAFAYIVKNMGETQSIKGIELPDWLK